MKRLIVILCTCFFATNAYSEQIPYLIVDQEVDNLGSITVSPSLFSGRKYSQSFIPTQDSLSAVQHSLLSNCQGSNGTIVEIQTDSGGFPSGTAVGFSFTSARNDNLINFEPPVPLIPGEIYHIVHYIFQDPCFDDSNAPGFVTSGDGYPMGQAYSTDETGNWQVGAPLGSSGNLVETDYIIKTFHTGFHESPVAIISGGDKTARANETVFLDGSPSNDPDGTIVTYEWRSLPSQNLIGFGPTVEYTAQGFAEEVIQLRVTDDKGGVAIDTISIWHPFVMN